MARMEEVVGPAVSSAMHLLRFKKEQQLIDMQIDKTKNESYASMMSGNLLGTQDQIASFGVPGSASFRALQERYRAELLRAQGNALRFSPFLAKYVGADISSRLRPRIGRFSGGNR